MHAGQGPLEGRRRARGRAALGNALGGDVLRDAFAGREEARALRPVIGIERFSTGR